MDKEFLNQVEKSAKILNCGKGELLHETLRLFELLLLNIQDKK